tara:strand:+ start:21 stop:413 length:393 start_codon:yes stop_codon:yes gene_type:complete
MIFTELTEDNFLLFAIKNYENPQAVTKDDFDKDLNHFKYIKRLLKRYKNTGELKTHLLLNHFIILYNIFGEACTPMLFFKIEKELWSSMKTFVIFLNRFPQYPKSNFHDVPVDLECLKQLNQVCKKDETS